MSRAAAPPALAVGAELAGHDEHLAGVVVAVAHDPLQQPAHAVGEVGVRELEQAVAPGDVRPRDAGVVREARGERDELGRPRQASR